MPETQRVKYRGASDAQVNWGQNDDPRECLVKGRVYDVIETEVLSWHTTIRLSEFPDLEFNDASFDYV